VHKESSGWRPTKPNDAVRSHGLGNALLPTRRGAVLLFALLAFAAAVRLPVLYGNYFHPDEDIAEAVVANIESTGRVDTNWADAPEMPVLFKYPQHNFAGFHVALAGWDLVARTTSLGSLRPVYRLRLFSALCFLISVALTFLLANHIGGGSAFEGAVAATLTAVSVQLFQDSLYARPEAFSTALALLTVVLLVVAETLERPQRSMLIAAALSGFLFSIKVSFIGYLPLVLAALFLGRPKPSTDGSSTRAKIAPLLALVLLLFLLGAWLGMPNAAVSDYLAGLDVLRKQYGGLHWPNGLGPTFSFSERMGYGASFLIDTIGLPVLALAAVGFAFALQERRWVLILSVGLAFAYVAYFMSTPAFFERNFSHALPLLFVSAAHGVKRLSLLLPNSPMKQAGLALLLVVAILPPVAVWKILRFEAQTGAYKRERNSIIHALQSECQCPLLRFVQYYDEADSALSLNGPAIIWVEDFGEHRRPPPWATGTRVWDVVADRAQHGLEVVRIKGPFHGVTTSTLQTYHGADDVLIKIPARTPSADSPSISIVPHEEHIAGGELGVITSANGWSKAGQNPELVLDPPEEAYGSWNGSDSHRGEIRVDMGSCRSLIAKWGTGANVPPAIKSQSLALRWNRNGRTEEVTAPKILLSQRRWNVYRFDLPAGAEAIEVVARDEGVGEGEWSAITVPKCISDSPSADPQTVRRNRN